MLFLSYRPLCKTLDDYDLMMNEKLRPWSLGPSIPDSVPETIVDGVGKAQGESWLLIFGLWP